MIVNPSRDRSILVRTDYYVLLAPGGLKKEKGSVSWSTADLLNIPQGKIAGYHVYLDGQRLNQKPVPWSAQRQVFRHASLAPTSGVQVSVVDRFGNQWPPPPPPPAPTKFGFDTVKVEIRDYRIPGTSGYRSQWWYTHQPPHTADLKWNGNQFALDQTVQANAGWTYRVATRGRISADGRVLESLIIRHELRYDNPAVPQYGIAYDQAYAVELQGIPLRIAGKGEAEYRLTAPQAQLAKAVRRWFRCMKVNDTPPPPTDPVDDPSKAEKKGTITVTFRRK